LEILKEKDLSEDLSIGGRNNIKMDLTESVLEGVNYIHVA
jgi:hypothetical protein